MTTHDLKIQEVYYNAILRGDKKCEIRFNDRDFQKGDRIRFVEILSKKEVVLQEGYDKEEWIITHVLNFPVGLQEGYVALSIRKIGKK